MEQIDIDSLVKSLQERVAARRAQGDYPPGLEEQLEAEFKGIMRSVHRDELGTSDLHGRIAAVLRSSAQVDGQVDPSSNIPGGRTFHRITGKVVRRQTGQLAETVRVMGTDIVQALVEVSRLFEAQRVGDERRLNEVLASVVDRLAVLDHVVNAVVDLERRIGALETASTTPR